MDKVFGVAVAVLLGVIVTIWNYFRFRTDQFLVMRAVGGAKPPCRWLVKWDHQKAVEWAQQVLAQPDDYLLIDVAETGPDKTDEIIEIAVTDPAGRDAGGDRADARFPRHSGPPLFSASANRRSSFKIGS